MRVAAGPVLLIATAVSAASVATPVDGHRRLSSQCDMLVTTFDAQLSSLDDSSCATVGPTFRSQFETMTTSLPNPSCLDNALNMFDSVSSCADLSSAMGDFCTTLTACSRRRRQLQESVTLRISVLPSSGVLYIDDVQSYRREFESYSRELESAVERELAADGVSVSSTAVQSPTEHHLLDMVRGLDNFCVGFRAECGTAGAVVAVLLIAVLALCALNIICCCCCSSGSGSSVRVSRAGPGGVVDLGIKAAVAGISLNIQGLPTIS